MPATISLSALSWRAPDGSAGFSDLTLTFAAERTGLIGRNGVGKTTLLKIITGEVTPASGSVTVDGTLGVLRQSVQLPDGQTIADLFGARASLAVLARAEAGEASVDELAHADWTIEARITAALAEVGLSADADTPLGTLSGGQHTRASLAALVFAAPDFLILDEPTNNLDRTGREHVARLIRNWSGGAIIVSHDRELLQEVDAIVEMTSLGATRYGGNWETYSTRKALELSAAEHDLADAEKRVAEVNRAAQLAAERKARRDSVGKRKAARGGIPRILLGGMKERAENTGGSGARLAERLRDDARQAAAEARGKIEILQPLKITLAPTNLPATKTVLAIDDVTAGYGRTNTGISNSALEASAVIPPSHNGEGSTVRHTFGDSRQSAGSGCASSPLPACGEEPGVGANSIPPTETLNDRIPILRDFSLSITGPERIALVGPNGSGKTTVLALVAGTLKPWQGTVRVPVRYALLDQRVSLLDPALSIRDNFRRLNPQADENACRAALARFKFRADAALQLVSTLSGGEMLRAGLACVIGAEDPPQLLMLDEPTNHLDIGSIEAVEAGLRAYDGALLVVSHDERFLDNIGTTRRVGLSGDRG